MKIDLLPIGSRFQWKGRSYTKVGPMTAAADGGGTEFVPKHAALQPIPGETPPPAVPAEASGAIDAAKVKAASRPITARRSVSRTRQAGWHCSARGPGSSRRSVRSLSRA